MASIVIGVAIVLTLIVNILATVRGWEGWPWLNYIVSTFITFILLPIISLTTFVIWAVYNLAVSGVMIWYGARGKNAFTNVVDTLWNKKGPNLIRSFQEWNQ